MVTFSHTTFPFPGFPLRRCEMQPHVISQEPSTAYPGVPITRRPLTPSLGTLSTHPRAVGGTAEANARGAFPTLCQLLCTTKNSWPRALGTDMVERSQDLPRCARRGSCHDSSYTCGWQLLFPRTLRAHESPSLRISLHSEKVPSVVWPEACSKHRRPPRCHNSALIIHNILKRPTCRLHIKVFTPRDAHRQACPGCTDSSFLVILFER